jgi:hypothetical protein
MIRLLSQGFSGGYILETLLEVVLIFGPFAMIFGFAIRMIWVDRRAGKFKQPSETSRGFEILPPKSR